MTKCLWLKLLTRTEGYKACFKSILFVIRNIILVFLLVDGTGSAKSTARPLRNSGPFIDTSVTRVSPL